MADFHDDDFYPHVPMSASDKAAAEATMLAGNPLFKKWALTFFGKQNKGKQFRREFFKGILCEGGASCPLIPGNEVALMKAVAGVEEKVIMGHVKLVRRTTKRIYNRVFAMTYLTKGDFILEGVMALREAVYNYTRSDIVFTTYAWKVVQRKVTTAVAKARDMGGVTDAGTKLMARYFQVKSKLPVVATFDGVIEAGGFTPEQADDLRSLLKAFVRPDTAEADESGFSLSQIAVDPDRGSNIDRMVIKDAFKAANLSDVERELIEAKMSGGNSTRSKRLKDGGAWGFLTEIASRHKNYRGETLTKQGARVILKRAESKLREALSSRGLDQAAPEPVKIKKVKKPVIARPSVPPLRRAVAKVAAIVVPVVEIKIVLAMPAPVVEEGLANDLGIPPTVLLAYVKRLLAGESRRKLTAEMNAKGYQIAVNTLYYRGETYKKKISKQEIAA